MSCQRKVYRYAAYFRGWCQAFGEHEDLSDENDDIKWLLAENQVGFILPAELTKALYREVLGRQAEAPTLTVSDSAVDVGAFHYQLSLTAAERGLDALRQLLMKPDKLHLYLTYHLFYRSGSRIMTLSQHRPLTIIYREIGPIHIRLNR